MTREYGNVNNSRITVKFMLCRCNAWKIESLPETEDFLLLNKKNWFSGDNIIRL